VFHALKGVLQERGLSTSVGDEGGFAPNLRSNREALDLVLSAIDKAGYKPGTQIALALDVAASSFCKNNKYHLEGEGATFSSGQMVDYLVKLTEEYPIISIEDGLDEHDWSGFTQLTAKIGQKIQIVGDDLFVTNPNRLAEGIKTKAANAILIK